MAPRRHQKFSYRTPDAVYDGREMKILVHVVPSTSIDGATSEATKKQSIYLVDEDAICALRTALPIILFYDSLLNDHDGTG
jgi:hypothetical protein